MFGIAALITMIFFVIGCVLLLQLDKRFFFFWREQYNFVAGWCFVLLLPIFTKIVSGSSFQEHYFRRYPTWWVRRLVMFPLTVMFLSGIVVIAPRGWLTFAVWLNGEERTQVPATVIDVEPFRRSAKGCDQYVKLKLNIDSTAAQICLENHFTGNSIQVGQTALLTGRASSIGFIVNLIEVSR